MQTQHTLNLQPILKRNYFLFADAAEIHHGEFAVNNATIPEKIFLIL